MNYEFCRQLKDAGFPFIDPMGCRKFVNTDGSIIRYGQEPSGPNNTEIPTLSELIEACGKDFAFLSAIRDHTDQIIKWHAADWNQTDEDNCVDQDCCPDATVGTTPEEAVARLWLALNKKS